MVQCPDLPDHPLVPFVTRERAERYWSAACNRTERIVLVGEYLYMSGNEAALLRTCEAMGVQHVYLIRGDAVKEQPHRRITKGSDRYLTLHMFEDTASCLGALKERGFRIWATTVRPGLPMTEPERIPLDDPVAVVLGNEHDGVGDEVIRVADGFTWIPLRGLTGSLNVSVAAALFLYCLRSRQQSELGSVGDLDGQGRIELFEGWIQNSVRGGEKILARKRSEKGK